METKRYRVEVTRETIDRGFIIVDAESRFEAESLANHAYSTDEADGIDWTSSECTELEFYAAKQHPGD